MSDGKISMEWAEGELEIAGKAIWHVGRLSEGAIVRIQPCFLIATSFP